MRCAEQLHSCSQTLPETDGDVAKRKSASEVSLYDIALAEGATMNRHEDDGLTHLIGA